MPRTKKVDVVELTPAALQKAINKRFGEGTMRMASDPELLIERIPCGILSLDYRMGGGFPRGRYVEIYGPQHVGKTYTTFKLLASAQDMGLRGAFVDVEETFDPEFAASVGVDLDTLAFHEQKGSHGNRIVDYMETLLRSRLYDVLVMDSVAALLPKAEYEADMEAGSYGTQQARLMSAALRKLTAANHKTSIVFINQIRENIGVTFGKKTITSGGRALGHYAGMRIEMVRTENITKKRKIIKPENGEEIIKDVVRGHRVLVRIEKDKTGGTDPGSQTTFVFDYDIGGVDHIEDLIYIGREAGYVHKKGDKWWVDGYEDEKQHGKPRFRKWLKRNVAVAEELEEWIRSEPDEAEDSEEEDDNE